MLTCARECGGLCAWNAFSVFMLVSSVFLLFFLISVSFFVNDWLTQSFWEFRLVTWGCTARAFRVWPWNACQIGKFRKKDTMHIPCIYIHINMCPETLLKQIGKPGVACIWTLELAGWEAASACGCGLTWVSDRKRGWQCSHFHSSSDIYCQLGDYISATTY